jgi:hypothetical protein
MARVHPGSWLRTYGVGMGYGDSFRGGVLAWRGGLGMWEMV